MDNKVRLNAQKRQALKKEWANTVYNKTPMQVDDDLQNAVSNYYEVKNKTWDSVISPLVEQFYPTADMQVIRKYETGTYRAMTTTDHCFVFKNIDSDDREQRYDFKIDQNLYNALYHFDLQAKGHQATIEVEYDETKRQENPHYHEKTNAMRGDYSAVAKLNDRYEDYALYTRRGYHNNDNSVSDSDYGKWIKTVISGGCHERAMACHQEHWEQLRAYERAKSMVIQSHIELWKAKYNLITGMNSVIDQAKFLDDVKEYWPDVESCIDLNTGQTIGSEVVIVSDDMKDLLKQTVNIRQANKTTESVGVVQSKGFAMVN